MTDRNADQSTDDATPTPPDDLPEDVAAVLRGLGGHDLREAIVYTRELLDARHGHPPEIAPQHGEEIVRVTEHEGYTEVVKRQPCEAGCDDCPHGPYLYHVTREPHGDGSSHQHWTFVGRVTLAE